MSRSPERGTRTRRDREASMESSRSRPEVDDPPSKKMRTDAKVEDKARNKRLFGNILGTLNKFKKEDKTSRTSEAAKRREEVSERIATKLRSEANLHHEIAESERELKTLRIATDSAEVVLRQKGIAVAARHAHMRPAARFLNTSSAQSAPLIFETTLLKAAPIPLNVGPAREPQSATSLKPLYFLPKILLPEQEAEQNSRIASITELIAEETQALEDESRSVTETSRTSRARIEELQDRLVELRRKVKPKEKADRDEFGREERRAESEGGDMDVERDRERSDGDLDREAGVRIEGENGDVEVEY